MASFPNICLEGIDIAESIFQRMKTGLKKTKARCKSAPFDGSSCQNQDRFRTYDLTRQDSLKKRSSKYSNESTMKRSKSSIEMQNLDDVEFELQNDENDLCRTKMSLTRDDEATRYVCGSLKKDRTFKKSKPTRIKNVLRPVAETVASKLRREIKRRSLKLQTKKPTPQPIASEKKHHPAKHFPVTHFPSLQRSDTTLSDFDHPKVSRQISDSHLSSRGSYRADRQSCNPQESNTGPLACNSQYSNRPTPRSGCPMSKEWSYATPESQTVSSRYTLYNPKLFLSDKRRSSRPKSRTPTRNMKKACRARMSKMSEKNRKESNLKFPECKTVSVKVLPPEFVTPDRVFGPLAPYTRSKSAHKSHKRRSKNSPHCTGNETPQKHSTTPKPKKSVRHPKCFKKKDGGYVVNEAKTDTSLWNKQFNRWVPSDAQRNPDYKVSPNICANNCSPFRDEVELFSYNSSDDSLSESSLETDSQSDEAESALSYTVNTENQTSDGGTVKESDGGHVGETKSSSDSDEDDSSTEEYDSALDRRCFSEDNIHIKHRDGQTEGASESVETDSSSRFYRQGCNFAQSTSHDTNESESGSSTSETSFDDTEQISKTSKNPDVKEPDKDEITKLREQDLKGEASTPGESVSRDSSCCCQDGDKPRLTVREMVKCLQNRMSSPDSSLERTPPHHPPRKKTKEWLYSGAESATAPSLKIQGGSVTVPSLQRDTSGECAAVQPKPRPRKVTYDGAVRPEKAEPETAVGIKQEPSEIATAPRNFECSDGLSPLNHEESEISVLTPTQEISASSIPDKEQAQENTDGDFLSEQSEAVCVTNEDCQDITTQRTDCENDQEMKRNQSFEEIDLSVTRSSKGSKESTSEGQDGTQAALAEQSQWAEVFKKAKLALGRMRSRSLSPSQVSAKLGQILERGKISFNKVIKSWSNMDTSEMSDAQLSETNGLSQAFISPIHSLSEMCEPLADPNTASLSPTLTPISSTLSGDSFDPVYCLRINSPNPSTRRRIGSETNNHRGCYANSTAGPSANETPISGVGAARQIIDRRPTNSDTAKCCGQSTSSLTQPACGASCERSRSPANQTPRESLKGSDQPSENVTRSETYFPMFGSSLQSALTHPSPLICKRTRSPTLESILETDSASDGNSYNLLCLDERSENVCVDEISKISLQESNTDAQVVFEMSSELKQTEEIKEKPPPVASELVGLPFPPPAEVPTRASHSDCSRETRHDLDQMSGHEEAPLKTQSLLNACDAGHSESAMTDMMALLSEEVNIKRYASYPDLTDLEDDDNKDASGAASLLCQRESVTAIQAIDDLELDEGEGNDTIEGAPTLENTGVLKMDDTCCNDITTVTEHEVNQDIDDNDINQSIESHNVPIGDTPRDNDPLDSEKGVIEEQCCPGSPVKMAAEDSSLKTAGEHHNSPQMGLLHQPDIKVGTMVSLLESCKVLSDSEGFPAQVHVSVEPATSSAQSLSGGSRIETESVVDRGLETAEAAQLYLPSPPTHSPSDESQPTGSSNQNGWVAKEGKEGESPKPTANVNAIDGKDVEVVNSKLLEKMAQLCDGTPKDDETPLQNNNPSESEDRLESSLVLDKGISPGLGILSIDHTAHYEGNLIGEACQNIKALGEEVSFDREMDQRINELENIKTCKDRVAKNADLEGKESACAIAGSPLITDDLVECEEQDSSLTGIQAISGSSGIQTPEEKVIPNMSLHCPQTTHSRGEGKTNNAQCSASQESCDGIVADIGEREKTADNSEESDTTSMSLDQQCAPLGKARSVIDSCDPNYKDQEVSIESDELNESKLNVFLNEDSGCDLSLNSQSRSYRSFSTDEDKSSGAGETLPLPCDVELKRKKKKRSKNLNSGEGPSQQPNKSIKVGSSSGSRSGSGSNSRALSTQSSPDLNADGGSSKPTPGQAAQPPRAVLAQVPSGTATSRHARKEIKWDDELSFGDHEEVSTQSSSDMSSNRCNSCMAKSRNLASSEKKRSSSLCKMNPASRPNDKRERTRERSYRSQVRRSPPPPGVSRFDLRMILGKGGNVFSHEGNAAARASHSSPTQMSSNLTSPSRPSQGDNLPEEKPPQDSEGRGPTVDKSSVAQWGDVGPFTKAVVETPSDITAENIQHCEAAQEKGEVPHTNCLALDTGEEAAVKVIYVQACNDEAMPHASNSDSEDGHLQVSTMQNEEHALNNNHSSNVNVSAAMPYLQPTFRRNASHEQSRKQSNRNKNLPCLNSCSTLDIASILTTPSFQQPATRGHSYYRSFARPVQAWCAAPNTQAHMNSKYPAGLPATSSSLGDLRAVGKAASIPGDLVSRLTQRVHSTDLGIARACDFVSRSQVHLDRCDRLIERSSDIIRRSQEMLSASRSQMETTFRSLKLARDKSTM
ncbi:hypothetical protein EGW08_019026 [Elysia chlorotica]|uniref:Uncharacterized protein n=1 Tax=Elysia chlorotica TaxID=188477 RepID=A0A433SV94_ELYCH|nr:hypothetical protein EGW08_019026 [Elysia chlorotica]